MKDKPISFLILASIPLLVALSIPFQIVLQLDSAPWELEDPLRFVSPLNLAVMGAAPLVGYLSYSASRWTLLTVPTWLALVGYNNWVVGQVQLNASEASTSAATLGLCGICLGLMVQPTALRAMFDPQSQWWNVSVRKRIRLGATLKGHDMQWIVRTFDLSETGAFFVLENGPHAPQPGQTLDLQLQPGPHRAPIRCKAKVVRLSPPRGQYPEGLGVQFEQMTIEDRRRLAALSSSQPGPLQMAA